MGYLYFALATVGMSLIVNAPLYLFGEIKKISGSVNYVSGEKKIAILILTFIGIILMSTGIIYLTRSAVIGSPVASLNPGSYRVIDYTNSNMDRVYDKGVPYYLLLQKDKDSNIKFYSIPGDMLTIEASNEKRGTIEVVEKAGLIKATFYQ